MLKRIKERRAKRKAARAARKDVPVTKKWYPGKIIKEKKPIRTAAKKVATKTVKRMSKKLLSTLAGMIVIPLAAFAGHWLGVSPDVIIAMVVAIAGKVGAHNIGQAVVDAAERKGSDVAEIMANDDTPMGAPVAQTPTPQGYIPREIPIEPRPAPTPQEIFEEPPSNPFRG